MGSYSSRILKDVEFSTFKVVVAKRIKKTDRVFVMGCMGRAAGETH